VVDVLGAFAVEEHDTDWTAYQQMLQLNPHLNGYDLGSSDGEGSEALLVIARTGEAFIVPRSVLYRISPGLVYEIRKK